MVSRSAPDYEIALVRLRHGDPRPESPGFKAALVEGALVGRYPGGVSSDVGPAEAGVVYPVGLPPRPPQIPHNDS
jgi:hypothetical protein